MLAFDTETTGLLRPEATELWLQPFITEIYICKFDKNFKVYDEFDTLLKPPVPIPDDVIQITGITNEMVSGAPSFPDIYHDLCKFFLGEADVFAHNCTFDIGMIKTELARIDKVTKFPWCENQHCTVEISQPLMNKRLSLEKLCNLAGVRYEKGHRAKNDVIMMVDCIKWLIEQELI